MQTKEINSHKDLIVWQKSMELMKSVYEMTTNFPKEEMYGLTSQLRRASVSIPSNIAEGKRRETRKDYRQFLVVAYGSGAELETQTEIAKMLALGKNANYDTIDKLLEEVMRMLNKLISSLQPTT